MSSKQSMFSEDIQETSSKQSSNNILDLKVKDLVKTFAEEQKGKDSEYFKGASKDSIVKDFKEYINTKYGDGLLQELLDSGKLDAEFNQFSEKGFTLKDFLTTSTKETIQEQLGSNVSERDALSQITMNCYKQWNKLPQSQKNSYKFDDFLSEIGYDKENSPDGEMIGITATPRSKVLSVVDLKKARDHFARQHTTDTEEANRYGGMMSTVSFDPTEKIACISATQELYSKVNQLPSSKRDKILQIFESRFGRDTQSVPVSAFESWIQFDGLERALSGFFDDVAHTGLVNDKEIKSLQSLAINPRTCIQYGTKSGEIVAEKTNIFHKKFSELQKKIQSLSDKLTTTNLINNISRTVDEIDTSAENFAKVFDMPGSMKGFFDQFSIKNTIGTVPSHLQKDYGVLTAEEESLREELESAQNEDDKETVKKIEHKIVAVRKKINSFNSNDFKPTMDSYIARIGEITEANLTTLNKLSDPALISGIQSALHRLKDNNRNAESLSRSEQNYLMKASVLAQLVKVKQSDTLTDLNHDFDEYAQFVSELFDFNSTQSVIVTKDHYPIEINFTENGKKMVGKPYNWQNISIENLTDLEQLHVEFEIDLDNDPGGQAAMFLKAVTGGQQSQIIRDMPFQREGYPETITDSTFVRLVDPTTGEGYEGYLSPAYIDQEDHEDIHRGSSNETYANTLVLYNKPADQYHPNREVVTMNDKATSEDNKSSENSPKLRKPVFLNADNASQWNMEVLKKRTTLSDKYINALALGHVVAKEHDLDRIRQEQIDSKFSDLEKRLDVVNAIDQRQMNEELSENTNTNELSEEANERPYEKLNTGRRNFLKFVKAKEDVSLVEGQRFALELQDEFKIGQVSIPKSKEYLSATVQSLKKDADGNVVSFEFVVENLTAGTSIKRKIRTINHNNIGMFSNQDEVTFASGHYLGNMKIRSMDNLSEATSMLSNLFPSDKNPEFLRSEFERLSMKDSIFYKGEKDDKGLNKVAYFTNTETTTDENGAGQYTVQYKVEPTSDGRYHVYSTNYVIDQQDDKDQVTSNRITTRFDTKVDMAGVLMILASKKLTAYTERELHEVNNDNVLPDIRRKTWRSPSRIIEFVKGDRGKIVEAWKKKREDGDKADFEYMIHNQFGLYRRLANQFGGILEFWDMDFLDDMASDHEQKGLDYGWKKIEAEYNYIKKFHHQANANLLGEGDSGQKGANALCEQRMQDAMEEYEHNNGDVSYKKRRKVAAGLLWMLEKYENGTARVMNRYPKGSYVKVLLGTHAYKIFLEKYKEKQKLVENSKYGFKIQEDLMTFEYNFIVHNIGGGSLQDERVRDLDVDNTQGGGHTGLNPNAWYFQRLYSREYANQLREKVGGIKKIDPAPESEESQKKIKGNPFGHMKKEFYSHIGQVRMADAVAEMVAMQQLARTQEEANEVFGAIMVGVLNGAFVYNLSMDTRDALRRTCRDSAIPFTPWMEYYDAPWRIQRMLAMCTHDLGEDSFTNLSYQRSRVKRVGDHLEKENLGSKMKYNPTDFDPFARQEGVTEGFTKKFSEWFGKPKVRQRIINFLTMDNINDDTDDNNMMNIWKSSKEDLPEIYGKKITTQQKADVDDLMVEFYFNIDRGHKLERLNWNYWYRPSTGGYKAGAHTRTMIQPAYTLLNEGIDTNGNFKSGSGDHSQGLWESIKDRLPEKKLIPSQRYKLSYFVDEFFRIFSHIGAMKYDKMTIETFYRRVRLLQERPGLTAYDKKRLLRFYITEQVYAKGSIPPIVEQALSQYMAFFEINVDMIDQKTVAMHRIPGAGASGSFEYVFTEDNSNQVYYSSKDREKNTVTEKSKREQEARRSAIILINAEMEQANSKASVGTNYASGSLNTTYDKKIDELRGSDDAKKVLNNGQSFGSGQSISADANKKKSGLQPQIHATNNDLIEWTVMKPGQPDKKFKSPIRNSANTGSSYGQGGSQGSQRVDGDEMRRIAKKEAEDTYYALKETG